MLPGQYDMMLYRGDTARLQFVMWHDKEKSQPVDLTGASAKAQIRDRPDSNAVLAELECSISLPNTVNVTVPSATASNLQSRGTWDLQITYPSGDIQTMVAGAMTVSPDVTR